MASLPRLQQPAIAVLLYVVVVVMLSLPSTDVFNDDKASSVVDCRWVCRLLITTALRSESVKHTWQLTCCSVVTPPHHQHLC